MEQTRICKACLMTKDIKDFYQRNDMKTGRLNVCKICKKIKKVVLPKPKLTEEDLRYELEMKYIKLDVVTQQDYFTLYEVLKDIGYDIANGDIHQQFCDTHNLKPKKRPAQHENAFLPSGERNEDYRAFQYNLEYRNKNKAKNNPTISDEV
jgi:hypothetical protein